MYTKKILKIKLYLIFIVLITINISKAENYKPIIDGIKNAKVKILIFESFTCSHCADFHKNVFPELKTNFVETDLVSIEYKNFPLDLAALNASKLAHCKNDGKSNLLHYLYLGQSKWAKGSTIEKLNSNLKNYIKDGGFKINVTKCLEDKILEENILNDRIEGVKQYDINSTPTIIINNNKFDKPLTYKNLKKALEKLL